MWVDVLVLVVVHIRAAKVLLWDFFKLNFISKDYSFEEIGKGKMEVSNFRIVSGQTREHLTLCEHQVGVIYFCTFTNTYVLVHFLRV